MAKKAYIGAPNFEKRNLPSGYTQVEYIESTGTQYIDTGFVPNQDTRVVCEAIVPISGTNWLYGARTSASSNAFAFAASTNGYYTTGYNTKTNSFDASLNSDGVIHIDANKSVTTLTSKNGSATITGTSGTFTAPCNLTLFGGNTKGTVTCGSVTIYSCQIYDNGTLVRDYVPCTNSAGVAGLYDMANGAFYQNAGTGAFAVGATQGEVARDVKKIYLGIDGKARKIKKAYIGNASGLAALCWRGAVDVATMKITSNAGMTDSGVVTMKGTQYRLLTLTSSGTLTVEEPVQAEVWMCGGGSSGGVGSSSGAAGGAGAYTATGTVTLSGTMAAVVGAGGEGRNPDRMNSGGASSFAGLATKTTSGKNGGTGGGGSYSTSNVGTGDGVTKYPFGDSSYFPNPHCAGGGGGAFCNTPADTYSSGGAGGTNGGNGSARVSARTGAQSYGGKGGNKGGGGGESALMQEGSGNASYYGSGGGGGGSNETQKTYGTGGHGYQGVIYIRIPVNQ